MAVPTEQVVSCTVNAQTVTIVRANGEGRVWSTVDLKDRAATRQWHNDVVAFQIIVRLWAAGTDLTSAAAVQAAILAMPLIFP